jgi:hypothetical protein
MLMYIHNTHTDTHIYKILFKSEISNKLHVVGIISVNKIMKTID